MLVCPWCGAPYMYKENLEIHEKSCPNRPAAQPVSRYILPVELQRKWIKNRESLWAGGKRDCEWGAGLYLRNERKEDLAVVGVELRGHLRDLAEDLLDLLRQLRFFLHSHYHSNPGYPLLLRTRKLAI